MFHNNKIRPRITHKANIHQVYGSFIETRGRLRDSAALADDLKNCGRNELISSALKNLSRTTPSARNVIFGNGKPETIEELGTGKNCYFFKPVSVENEINWAIQCLKPYKNLIAAYIQVRDEVEALILKGEFEAADRLLDLSINDFGHSVWYYEMKLTIAGYQEKIDRALELLTEVNTKKKNDTVGFVRSLLYTIFNRSQKKVSALEFDSVLYSKYKRNRTDFQNDRFNYFLFRLNYYQHYDIEDLSVIMIMENLNSFIDRYNTLIFLLRSYSLSNQYVSSKFGLKLYGISGDKRLCPFIAISNISELPEDYFHEDFIKILNQYYTGAYDAVVRDCKRYIEKDPSNFDVIKIYSRALLFLKSGYQTITKNAESPVNRAAKNVYMVMTQNDHDRYLDDLYQLSKNLYGLHFAGGLDFFIKEEQKVKRNERLRLQYIYWFDPIFANIFDNLSEREEYLKIGQAKFPTAVVVNYQLKRVRKEVSDDTHVVDYIRKTDNAKIVYETGNYLDALELWNKILEDNIDYIPTVQTAVDYIFQSYSHLGVDYRQSAIRFYIEKFMFNRAFVSKVETDEFMDIIKKDKYNGLKNDLDFLIFIFLNAKLYPQKEFVLHSYCKYEGVEYPSELIDLLKNKNRAKLELFFCLILSDDILYHYYKLKSTVEVLDEKLKIVSFLKNLRPEEKLYSQLCTELMHELVAYRGMKKMNDSKIYVNEDAVMKYELNNIEDVYERFKKQAALVNKNRVYLLVSDIDVSNPDSSSEIIKDAVSYSEDAITEVALQLFDIIRHAFLKSRFGLGTYLSTRIRHGVFEGEMRSGLEQLGLIFNTSGNTYVPITYWKSTFNIDPANNTLLNSKLTSFSREIDTIISSFKDRVIQIHENETDAFVGDFNYEIPTKDICHKMLEFDSKCNNAKELCLSVISYLWEITETCLSKIRNKVQEELANKYFDLLGRLENEIAPLSSLPQLYAELHATINMAREEITARISKVQKWFYKQETKFEDFKLEDHIRMAFDSAVKYLPDVPHELTQNIEDTRALIKAEYSPSMFDMLTIFITNILQHGSKREGCKIVIGSKRLDSHRQLIHFENDLDAGVDEEKLNEIFQTRLASTSSLQKEGGSGLVKAMNIIKYDFNNPTNSYTIEAKDGKCLIDIVFNLDNMLAL